MPPVIGQSTKAAVPGVKGENTGGGHGVEGESTAGRGVVGRSTDNYGVSGDSTNFPGVRGTSVTARGVEGWSTNNDGVWGISTKASGVHGVNEGGGTGVMGTSKTGKGVHGFSESGSGIYGECKNGRAIEGWSETSYGVSGDSRTFAGVRGTSVVGTGTEGWSTHGIGVFATSERGEGLHAETRSPDVAAIAAYNLNQLPRGAAVFAKSTNGEAVHAETRSAQVAAMAAFNPDGVAGHFGGNVHVTKNLTVDGDIVLTGADFAEDFDTANADFSEPGTVMILNEEGALSPSQSTYDKRVAGVVSGAGNYRPAIILDKQNVRSNRKPIALLGKVFCKVDATFASVGVGDLLTTSSTPGHAMKAVDPAAAFGAVIGKALRSLREGQGLIPILVCLQ